MRNLIFWGGGGIVFVAVAAGAALADEGSWAKKLEEAEKAGSAKKSEEAEKAFQGAAEEAEGLGKEDPRLVRTLRRWAAFRKGEGRYGGAAELHRRALALGEKVSGRDHPDLLEDLEGLAESLYRTRNSDEADYLTARADVIRTLQKKGRGSDEGNPAAEYAHLPSGMRFPPMAGGFKREEVIAFAKKAQGECIQYLGPHGLAASVFVYPVGVEEGAPGAGARADPVAAEEEGILKAMALLEKAGDIRDFKKVSSGEVGPSKESLRPPGRKAVFEYGVEGTKAESRLYLFAVNDFFVKFRVTCPAGASAKAAPLIEPFVLGFSWPAPGESAAEKDALDPEKVRDRIERFLADPLENRWAAARIAAFAARSEDVEIVLSPDALPWMKGPAKVPHGDLFLAAYLAGNARAQLDRKEKKDDPRAGILALIRVYEFLKKKEPALAVPGIEEAAALEKGGKPRDRPAPPGK